MNLIVISKMSIYDELAYECRQQKIQIEMREAIEAVRTINRSHDIIKSIKESDAIIFQSKNAVLYSSDYHELMDNCKKYYCIGKYTAKIINEMINQNALYPKGEYSSEALIEEIIKSNEKDKKFVVIKGVGGRKYIEAILAQSNNVNIVEVYERKRINGFIAESDLKKNDNNYILASSKEAYDHFINSCKPFIDKYNITYIIPSNRLITPIEENHIKKVIIIDNAANADQYIKRIKNHERNAN